MLGHEETFVAWKVLHRSLLNFIVVLKKQTGNRVTDKYSHHTIGNQNECIYYLQMTYRNILLDHGIPDVKTLQVYQEIIRSP